MSGTERDTLALLYQRIAQVTQGALAERLGVSASQMSRIVAGENGLTLDRIPVLLDALDLYLIERSKGTLVTATQTEYAALVFMAERGIEALKQQHVGERGG